MQVGTIARPRVHRDVVAELARRILSGTVLPGERLPNTVQLSADLGVSRSALREAIKVLTAKGMLEVQPRTGMRVRPRDNWNLMDPELLSWCGPALDAELLRSLLECRQLIEPGAASLAAANATAAQLAVMEEAFNRMNESSDQTIPPTLGENHDPMNIDDWISAENISTRSSPIPLRARTSSRMPS